MLVVLALCAHFRIDAQINAWYEPCRRIEPGTMMLGEMPAYPQRVDAHVRVGQPEPHGSAAVTLAWNAADSLNYSYARLDLTGHDDDIYLGKAILTIGKTRNGVDNPSASYTFDPSPGYESLRLIYDGFSARVSAKGDAYPVDYDPAGPTTILLITDRPIRCRRLTALGRAPAPLETSSFANLDSLIETIEGSTDKAEGIWEYMDRDIRPGAASLGGQYRLATARNPGGGYDIIYLDGAEANASRWRPMTIKGWLKPTIFTGHYDLRWVDAHGNLLERECNAQLDPNGAILILRFPLQNAQLRLRRLSMP